MKSETQPRYFVDERGGCIAVRDREHTDPEDRGLHPDTQGVTWYRWGERIVRRCQTCGHETHSEWLVSAAHVAEAHEVCAKLNRECAEGEREQ